MYHSEHRAGTPAELPVHLPFMCEGRSGETGDIAGSFKIEHYSSTDGRISMIKNASTRPGGMANLPPGPCQFG
jgi:hypothetical protein